MRFPTRLFTGVLFVLLSGSAALAEIKVATECNRGDDATPRFKFKKIAGPVDNDAASKAKFTVVDGQIDGNSGDLSVTHDGKLPSEEDQPDRNFFFAEGEDGGRLRIDLGEPIEIKQVNTYSWHPNTRGPQVYKLFAADGTARGFDAQPKKGSEPAKCGWRFVAAVDTRGKDENGGQYGVSISDSSGAIGKYRYLLFDIAQAESDDNYGNTFFSRINVIEATPKAQPPSQSPGAAKYRITIDYAGAPQLDNWVKTKLQPTCDEWYPKIIEALPSKGFAAPQRVAIVITKDYHGVAATGGNQIVCNADWFTRNYNGEAPGAVVHELVHVVQQYRDGSRNPGWLVEGIADYIRWFKYEPRPTGTRPRDLDHASYTDGYRTAAGFLNYLVEKHDKLLVVKLNAAMREGKYRSDLWKEYTGKSVDELWKEYVATLRQPG